MKTNWPAKRHGFLFLVSFALMASPLLAQSPLLGTSVPGNTLPSAAAPATARGAEGSSLPTGVIVGVRLTNDGQRTLVRLNAAGQVTYRVSRMQNPDRLVLDFRGARIGTGKTTIPSELAPVRAVRLGQFKPEIARVVIDLAGAAPYSVQRDGKAVVVVFASEGTVPQVTTALARNSDPARERAAEFKFNTVSHAVRPRRSALRQASSVPIPKIDLPAELTQPSAYFARLAGSRQAQNPPAPPTPDTGAGQQPTPTQQPAPTQPAPPPPAPTQAPAPVTRSGEKYTGTPLSVNLKAVDLVDFFRLITEVSGLNVVIDPAVKGSLSIVLNDVPWDQALDIVLQNNGLDKQLNGNVLRIATKETLKKEAETQFDLVKAQSKAIDLVTVTRVLSYAKASTMKDTLKKFASERGDIISDDRSNTLIIHDIPSVIPALDNLIRQLDKRTQQVEIEARVVSATRSFARDIGTQFAFSTTGGKSTVGGALGASPIFRTVTPPFTSPALVFGSPPVPSGTGTPQPINVQMPLVTNLGAVAPTSGISYLFTSPNFALDYIITAAEAKGIGKLLSKPKVSTQNNEKATVKQGVKIPVQTVINNTITVQYVDAVLKLEVTPQITADGTIFMDVLVENTQIDNGIPRVQGIPALDTQAVESKILVNDGGTAVIGGVIVSNQQTNITEVPIIGSLPLIGHLFRRDNISNTSTELLFFLTPRIVPG
jgi:type IV pilus assembly protein PilQ